jgi:hypothetical protein
MGMKGFAAGPGGSRIQGRGASVTNDRNRLVRTDRRTWEAVASLGLPITADMCRGVSNLAFQPRAGNVSSDTRAGIAG